MAATITVDVNGNKQQLVLKETTFTTGSTGFRGLGKLELVDNGKIVKYQINCMAVKIGSKPKA